MQNIESQPNKPEQQAAERSRLGAWIGRMKYAGKHRAVGFDPSLANTKMKTNAEFRGDSIRKRFAEDMNSNQGDATTLLEAAGQLTSETSGPDDRIRSTEFSDAISMTRGDERFGAMHREYTGYSNEKPGMPHDAIQSAPGGRPDLFDSPAVTDYKKLMKEYQGDGNFVAASDTAGVSLEKPVDAYVPTGPNPAQDIADLKLIRNPDRLLTDVDVIRAIDSHPENPNLGQSGPPAA